MNAKCSWSTTFIRSKKISDWNVSHYDVQLKTVADNISWHRLVVATVALSWNSNILKDSMDVFHRTYLHLEGIWKNFASLIMVRSSRRECRVFWLMKGGIIPALQLSYSAKTSDQVLTCNCLQVRSWPASTEEQADKVVHFFWLPTP